MDVPFFFIAIAKAAIFSRVECHKPPLALILIEFCGNAAFACIEERDYIKQILDISKVATLEGCSIDRDINVFGFFHRYLIELTIS